MLKLLKANPSYSDDGSLSKAIRNLTLCRFVALAKSAMLSNACLPDLNSVCVSPDHPTGLDPIFPRKKPVVLNHSEPSFGCPTECQVSPLVTEYSKTAPSVFVGV